jgi:tRNA pseudouridine38-40 synthase
MRNIRIVIEYDGTDYCGWQVQPNGLSIQEVLENTIARITQETVRVTGSGRTDAGVHALNQVANFMTHSSIPCLNLLRGINSLLPRDIAVKDVRDVDENFHARYSAKSKIYLYRINNLSVRSALGCRYAWHISESIDIDIVDESSRVLIGTHDFSSFCASDDDSVNHIRTITSIGIHGVRDGSIEFLVEANGFLRYMVRNIVGTLIDVGKRKVTVAEFRQILEASDRTKAGITAPPHGLYLKEVKYN